MGIKVGVVGAGYWGPNIIRNLTQIPTCEMAICCDMDENDSRTWLACIQVSRPPTTTTI